MNKISEYKQCMKYERYPSKNCFVGIEKMIEKEDLTLCKSLSKVAVRVFFFVINTGQHVIFTRN